MAAQRMHYALCKHKFYHPRHNSRVARQLRLGRTEKLQPRGRNSARIVRLDQNSFLFERATVCRFRSVNLTLSWSSHGTTAGFDRVWSTSAEPTLTSISYSSKHKPGSPWSFQTTLNRNKIDHLISPPCCIARVQDVCLEKDFQEAFVGVGDAAP